MLSPWLPWPLPAAVLSTYIPAEVGNSGFRVSVQGPSRRLGRDLRISPGHPGWVGAVPLETPSPHSPETAFESIVHSFIHSASTELSLAHYNIMVRNPPEQMLCHLLSVQPLTNLNPVFQFIE